MIEIVYITQRHCGLCEFFRPTIQRICSENGWEYQEKDTSTIMPVVIEKEITQTPAILVYVGNEYRGKIEGVKRKETISKLIRKMASHL